MHKTRNGLNALPTSLQQKAKQALQNIWGAETNACAEKAFEVFLQMYDLKYPKATACFQKDREALLTFSAIPAEHWPSLRTANPIESTLGRFGIGRRERRAVSRTRDRMLHMMLKLGQCAERTFRRLRGFRHLPKVIEGVQFIDGSLVSKLS